MSTAAILSSPRSQSARPWTLTAAIWLTIVNGLGSIAPLPWIAGDIPAAGVGLSIAFAIVVLAGAWGIWQGWKWAAIVVFVVTAINALLSIPGVFAAPTTTIKVLTAIGLPILVATCVLLAARQTRQALH